jgi:hypothetical protein
MGERNQQSLHSLDDFTIKLMFNLEMPGCVEQVETPGNGGDATGHEVEFNKVESGGIGGVNGEDSVSMLVVDERPGAAGADICLAETT